MIFIKKIAILLFSTSVFFTSCSKSMEIDLSKLYEKTYHYELPNGLVVILKEVNSTPITAIHLRVHTGSIHEEQYYGSGLSHFFEHSLFLGSKNFAEKDSFAHAIESYGGANLNAYTTYDHTAYYCTVLSEHTEKTLSAFSDLVFNPLFHKEHVKNEMGSILSEMDMRNDNPDSIFSEFTSQLIFKNAPYQYPIIGFRERFKKLQVEELLTYYYKRYKPNNMTLSVVGDFNAKEMIAVIDKYYGNKKKDKVSSYTFESEEPFKAVTGETTHPKAKFTRVSFTWQSVSYYDKEMYPLDVLAHLLTADKGSLLHERLKDDMDLIEEVSGYSWTPKEKGVFVITFSLPILQDKNAIKEKIEKIKIELQKILSEIAAGKIETYRVNSVKSATLNSFINQLETTMGMARSFAGSVMATGGIQYDKVYFEGIQKVNKKSIAQVTKKLLSTQPYVTSILVPYNISKQQKDGTYTTLYEGSITKSDLQKRKSISFQATDDEKQKKALQKKIKGINANPSSLQVIQETINKNRQTKAQSQNTATLKNKLANGLTTLHHHDKKLPKITVVLSGLGGVVFEGTNQQINLPFNIPNGSFTLWQQMFLTSNQKYTRAQLIRKLKENGISAEPFSGKNSFGISLTFLKDNLNEASDILKSIILNEKYDLDDFNREKKELIFELKAQEEQGWLVSRNAFIKRFFTNTVYANPSEGTTQSIESITADDLQKLRSYFIDPKQIVFSAYGDISATEFNRYFTPWLKTLPSSSAVPKTMKTIKFSKLNYQGEKSIHIDHQKGTQQAYMRMGYRAPTMEAEDASAFHILHSYLSGMGGPLFKLRSAPFKNSGGGRAYQLGASYSDSLQYGVLLFYVALRYEAKNEYLWAVKSFQKEVDKVKTTMLSDEEFKRAKLSIVGEELSSSQRLSSRAFEENLYELYNLGYNFYTTSFVNLKKVSKQDVLNVANRYLKEYAFMVHVLMPEKK